ncbi:MAG: galactokinase [Planctomycetota bacterium]
MPTSSPTHSVRAPGRVNLIGEHTDYNGLPVFPMAIQRSVRIELRPRDDTRVCLANPDPRFEAAQFEISGAIDPSPAGSWINYAKAAAQALHRREPLVRGFDGFVSGDIPAAAGLASSSALVVASALALLAANEIEIDLKELMELTARAERYVGTHSGGMDQAISLGGRAGHAVAIDFDPIRLDPVPVPSDWRFVIANSLVEAKKTGEAQAGYNARVLETRRALEILAKRRPYRSLIADLPEGELLDLARTLPDPLDRRFRHVVGEGLRVAKAVAAMRSGSLESFGRLLDASHASLRDDYEVSCPELDELVAAAREHGAAGARLTGAGFGGCAVLLTRAESLAGFLTGLRGAFYGSRGIDPFARDALFVAEPSDGARSIRL